MMTYTINVTTGKCRGAGTDTNVYVILMEIKATLVNMYLMAQLVLLREDEPIPSVLLSLTLVFYLKSESDMMEKVQAVVGSVNGLTSNMMVELINSLVEDGLILMKMIMLLKENSMSVENLARLLLDIVSS